MTQKHIKKQEAMGELYASLMEEVKVRAHAIDLATKGTTGLPSPIVRELCYLQLRMICEVIALGCLVAHGEIGRVSIGDLRNYHEADKIINKMEHLLPGFYPKPTIQNIMPDGSIDLTDKHSGFLTKNELLALYHTAGNVLHRGKLKKILSTKMPIEKHYLDIQKWYFKIIELLEHHTILLEGGERMLACMMNASGLGGRVQFAIFDRVVTANPMSSQ